LDEKVAFLAVLFEAHGIPYAIGGAVALLYWGEPRGTVDIDVNVFLPSADARRIAEVLVAGGLRFDEVRVVADVAATGQVRVDFAGTPLDLFFLDVPFHDSCNTRKVRVPFGDGEMNVLSAEDLVVCKAMFNRPKDWADIEQVLYTVGERFEVQYARRWLIEMLGAEDERTVHLERLAAEARSWLETNRPNP